MRDVRPTLLIVDDHAAFREAARALLEAEGFDVIGEAEDGNADDPRFARRSRLVLDVRGRSQTPSMKVPSSRSTNATIAA